MNTSSNPLILVGAGGMARDYAHVLKALPHPFQVIGRSETSALAFEQETGISVRRGGLNALASDLRGAPSAIVAVGVEALHETTVALIAGGVRRILVEKPAGLDGAQIDALSRLADATGTELYVAYNRRFYSSVRHARKIVAADGGLQTFSFEFTEWAHEIVGLAKAPGVKPNWVLGNSSHVLDLAFFLGGAPTVLYPMHDGSLSWHPASSRFVGCGATKSGALFSYQANWDAPGRWGVELCTSQHRIVLRPMETLQVMRKGSISIDPLETENAELDKRFKPGLYLQTSAFLHGDAGAELCPIAEHRARLDTYLRIAGYPPIEE